MIKFNQDVYVVGVGLHPFSRAHINQRTLAFTAAAAALKDANLRFHDVGYVFNGYHTSLPMDGVRFLKDLGLTGVSVVHVENASATGSSAFREAVLRVASGQVEVAMALAFDNMNHLPNVMGLDMESVLLPAAFFGLWGTRRMHDNGTTKQTYAKIAAKNWNNARLNPYAQRQSDHEVTVDEVLASKKIAEPFTSMMGCAVGCGGGCAIVANYEVASRVAKEQGRPMIKVSASAMESERYTQGHVFLGAVVGPAEMTRATARLAYEQSGFGPSDLNLVHVHDAFPVEELMYYELLGICGDGEGDRLVWDGDTEMTGRIPFSTDGGLIARGHPGAPTGIAQVHEIVTQLRGEANKRQLPKPRIGMAHMVGGGSVCIIHILERV